MQAQAEQHGRGQHSNQRGQHTSESLRISQLHQNHQLQQSHQSLSHQSQPHHHLQPDDHQHAAEALRIAEASQSHHLQEDHHQQLLLQQAQQQQAQQAQAQAHLQQLQQHHHQSQFHPQNIPKQDFPELSEYDLKSRDSKYRRWTPKMDQFLIKLLSDLVHSFPKNSEAEMSKKLWAYVCGHLRAANPETVYSTYTKYSCQQHLLNVNHHRYKIWYVLMLHQKNNPSSSGYSYRWNPDLGRFQIIDNTTGSLILDERQVKSLLYSEALSLPSLSAFNKGNLIVNDFFLSDNLKYISVYHNEVLPLLIRLDSKYSEGLGDIYHEIPKFEYHESSNEYSKPLIFAKVTKPSNEPRVANNKIKKRHLSESSTDINIPFSIKSSIEADDLPQSQPTTQDDESVDPALKRSRNVLQDRSIDSRSLDSTSNTLDFENALASAAIAAINSPPVTNGRDVMPFYIKDRKWFNKLVNLNESGHVAVEEVLSICEGVRDGKIPIFMLNILDNTYFPSRNVIHEEYSDEEMAKRIREFMLPMVFTGQ